MKTINKRLIACAVTAALTIPMTAMATNGYFAHGYGMKAKGMGGAGVAYAQDAMAAATNPAGITAVNDRIDFGVDLFIPDRSATVYTVARDGNETANFFIPEFGYSKKIDDSSAWAVVVYGNGGMNTDYKTGIYSTSAQPGALNDQTPTGINLEQLFIAPTYAKKLNETHSIGVSLNLVYQTFEANGLSNFIGFKEDPSTGKAGLTGQGVDSSTGIGLKLGWTGQVSDSLTLGFTYQPETKMSKFSSYNNLFANDGEFNIPSTYAFGLAFKASPKMNIAFDIQQINYSDIAAISNKDCGFTVAHPGTCDLGDAGGPGFGWDDVTAYKLGVDYKVSDKLVVRGGYNYGEQPISSTETAFNVLAPGVVEAHYTLGATWTLANMSELTVSYMYAPEVEVIGSSPAGFSDAGHGDIAMSQTSLGVAYGWKF
ncbi:MAG: outer membrane protein transport protein [Woeseiaceae bacterium]